MKLLKQNKRKIISLLGGLIIFVFLFPSQLFDDPYSTVITDKEEGLLSARIAKDGQWRFPAVDSIPLNLTTSILYFEDEYFHWHPGVNPISLARAFWQNFTSGKVKRGGSTISMQVIRLSRKNRKRTYFEKLIEVYMAFRMECSYSKEAILKMYASHAPYGGNVVGVEAASWRYFKRPIQSLSWAEYCTLAVLPNAPSLIHPGRNRSALRNKRDRLLRKLLNNDIIDSVTYSLSIMELIPEEPHSLPTEAWHLLDFAVKSGKEGQRIKTTIDKALQVKLSNQLDSYVKVLSENEIRNACAIVVSLDDGEVIAYVGNSRIKESGARFVDLIHAKRSSGSILKPFLYGSAIADGMIHTTTLLRDVPVLISKFSPVNFDNKYSGVVPAGDALAKSLNVPAAVLLRDYGIAPFLEDLQKLGFETIDRSASNYGLTLVLGGAEIKLWDLAKSYANQAKELKKSTEEDSLWDGLKLWDKGNRYLAPDKAIDPGAWWLVSDALTNLTRPELDQHWKVFSSSRKIAWKTGTSFGFRDAWAVGYDAGYLVAVWVGNAEGDGRPGLTGVSKAAPLMFEAFQYLPRTDWFEKPETSLRSTDLCAVSGMSPTVLCPRSEVEVPLNSKKPDNCTFHTRIFIDDNGKRVFRECAVGPVKDSVWFNMDPIAGYYFKKSHQNYNGLPKLAASCKVKIANELAIVYPTSGSKIIIPKDFDKNFEKIVFEAVHVDQDITIFWHLDEQYIGSTIKDHQLSVKMDLGKHKLLIIDELGNKASCGFKVY